MTQQLKEVQASAPGGTDLDLKSLERPDISGSSEPTMDELLAQLAAALGTGGTSVDYANDLRMQNIRDGVGSTEDDFGGFCVC